DRATEDLSFFAQKIDSIVVTISYRVGIFGFFASDTATNETTNFGFLDQRLAIQWILDNTIAFGGDNGKITIGGPATALTFQTRKKATNISSKILLALSKISKNIGDFTVNSMDDLFEVNFRDLLSVYEISMKENQILQLQYLPIVDGITLKTSSVYMETWNKIRKDKPIMVSTVTNEARSFIRTQNTIDIRSFRYMLLDSQLLFGMDAKLVEKTYFKNLSLHDYPSDLKSTIENILTDFLWHCPISTVSKQNWTENIYMSLWTQPFHGYADSSIVSTCRNIQFRTFV
ncbi:hypothetical protein HK096_004041, partial [Nowakowskiella sp. JEL0078]